MKDINSRKRYLAALEHRQPYRPAFSWGFGPQPPVRASLNTYLEQWNLDFEELFLRTSDERYVELPYIGPELHSNQTIWGYTTKAVSYGTGHYDEVDYYPLAEAESVDDIECHSWPDPKIYNFESILGRIKTIDPNREYATVLGGGNPFEILTWMAGMEKTMIDMLIAPDMIHAAMRRITDFFIARTRSALEAANGEIDIVFCADDLGTQKGLIMSPATYREMIKPYQKEFFAMIHQYGAKVMYHSDGSVFDLLNDLIEVGVDCLEAVQVECADMQPEKLKQHVGDRLAFRGAVSVQKVLPCCTPEQVRHEVKHLKNVLGKDGGYICAPSHALQAGTPPENVIAMVEEAVGKTMLEIAAVR